jgi:hypothetical protein
MPFNLCDEFDKIFVKVSLKTRSFERSRKILLKASHLVSLRMIKECSGTKEEFVYLMSRKSRI